MKWIRWTKAKLRFYVTQDLHRRDIHNELLELDEDIHIRVTRYDEIRTSGWLPSSPVEREVEHREDARERLFQQLRELNAECERITEVLKGLSGIERRALEWAYMQLSYNADVEVAKRLNLPLKEFWTVKTSALHNVYTSLKGICHTIDLKECVELEEKRHKWALRLNQEQKEERESRRHEPINLFFDEAEPWKRGWTSDDIENRLALLKKYDQMILNG